MGGERTFGGETGKRRVDTVVYLCKVSLSQKKTPTKIITFELLYNCQTWTNYLSEQFKEQDLHCLLWNMFTFLQHSSGTGKPLWSGCPWCSCSENLMWEQGQQISNAPVAASAIAAAETHQHCSLLQRCSVFQLGLGVLELKFAMLLRRFELSPFCFAKA